MPPSPTSAKALLAGAGLVFVAGAALAVAKPGDLGDDDGTADEAAAVTSTSTTVLGGASTTSVTVAPGGDGTPTTTGPGSGLGTDGASVADHGTAATGIESMLAPGLGLLAAAGAARAAARRRT